MKILRPLFLSLGIPLFACIFFACEDKIKGTETYLSNLPVYMSYEEFRSPIKSSSSRQLTEPGKICMYGNFLLINEIQQGIHIIDNTDPANPKNTAFLEIPGNMEMAVSGNYLFADSYTDLVCFDLSNFSDIRSVSRAEKVFPYALPSPGNQYPIERIEEEKGVVVGWETKSVTKKIDFEPNPDPIYYDYMMNESAWTASGAGSKSVSITGSMAKYAIQGDYLYAVDKNRYALDIFRLERNKASKIGSVYLNGFVETIFSYQDLLFFGTPNGMLIYSVANPQTPELLSTVRHILGCDPVVVQGDYAYLTIRMGNFCGQGVSQLCVYNISQPKKPLQVGTFTMEEPYGLSIDGDKLFVCDKGLKVFDATTPSLVGGKLLKTFTGIHGYDVIAYNNLLMMIGNNGLYQYDYSNVNDIRPLGSIAVSPKITCY